MITRQSNREAFKALRPEALFEISLGHTRLGGKSVLEFFGINVLLFKQAMVLFKSYGF